MIYNNTNSVDENEWSPYALLLRLQEDRAKRSRYPVSWPVYVHTPWSCSLYTLK